MFRIMGHVRSTSQDNGKRFTSIAAGYIDLSLKVFAVKTGRVTTSTPNSTHSWAMAI